MPADNNTRVVAARLDAELATRLERVAAADQRTLNNAIRILITRGLPEYEREVLGNAAPKPEEVAA
jgi:predicted DNA-binding protein